MKTNLNVGMYRVATEPPLTVIVQDLLEQFREVWWSSSSGLPELGKQYALREQLHNERELDGHLRALVAELQRVPQAGASRLEAQERIEGHLTPLAKGLLGLDDADIQAIRGYGFADVGLEFFRMARRFDPDLSTGDIYQASRNVWSMNFMQLLTGLPVQMTPAIFAYSMLYPYTDNYLDDPAISTETKRSFNGRFRQRLAGESVLPSNRHEQRISDLIGMIEGQFDRSRYPQVYESLLAIHRAQGRSLALLRGGASPYEVDVLGLVFEKGGTSVLADGYLVSGSLTPAQQEWMFFYGVFTQLMDDLEDIREDLKAGCLTFFSQTARRWPLDAITNRTIHLGRGLIERLQALEAPGAEAFKGMIAKCLDPLLIASIGEMGEFYSRPYLRELEGHYPARFSFLKKQRRRLSRLQIPVTDLVEAFVVTK